MSSYTLQEEKPFVQQVIALLALTALAVGVSAAAWFIWGLRAGWSMFAFIGLLMPFVLAMVKDVRRFVMWWLLFLIPLGLDYKFFYQRSISGHSGLAVGTTEILLCVLVVQWLISAVRERNQRRIYWFPAITLPTLALITMAGLSLLAARSITLGLFDIAMYVKMLIFFLFLANNLRDQQDVALALSALLLGLVMESGIMVAQYYTGSALGLVGTEELSNFVAYKRDAQMVLRPGGTVGNVNGFARYLGYILPVASILMLTTRERKMFLLSLLAGVGGLVALILTQSRSVWGAYLIAMLLALLFVLMRHLITLRTLKRMGAALLLIGGLVFFYGDTVYNRLTGDDHGSAKSRLTTARVALEIINDHPVIGVGVNNYDSYIRQYWHIEDPFTKIAVVHNNYLLILAEMGVIGFGAFLWLLAALLVRTVKAMQCRVKFFREVAVGLFASVVCFLLASLADGYKSSLTLMYLFWTIAAITEALIRLDEGWHEQTLEFLIQERS
ncbi:MAG TPA: O-antigen ligase family protein [bacterium]|nr:O-antigen ligase family protein [bacterium]HPR87888.1 O-antigen ligase family protein [bacterium]